MTDKCLSDSPSCNLRDFYSVACMVMEHHPIAGYHEKGLGAGLARLLAHMLHGATLGWVASLMT